MTEDGNKKPSVRKLTVDNFSVIKHAELEFGKITVLIGPQASGKSLLCKLAFFMGREVLETAANSAMNGQSLDEFKRVLVSQFVQRFSSHSGLGGDASVVLSAGSFSVNFTWFDIRGTDDVSVKLSEDFEKLYVVHARSRGNQVLSDTASRRELQNDTFISLSRLLADGDMYDTVFIPADRSLFTDANKGFLLLQNPAIDPLTSRFGPEIVWGGKWKAGSLTAGDGALMELSQEMIRMAGGSVRVNGGEPVFKSVDGRDTPLPLLSSGTQELLPLLNVLERFATQQEHRQVYFHSTHEPPQIESAVAIQVLVYIEEPEANLFPSTQSELVRLFAWLSSRPYWDFYWVITTHSPYILTSFNTLIEAWRAGNKERKREMVNAIIPERYWVNEVDFAAYTIRDGVLIPIFRKETEGVEGSGLIDGDYLDSVSSEIGGIFEKLLDIEYAGQS